VAPTNVLIAHLRFSLHSWSDCEIESFWSYDPHGSVDVADFPIKFHSIS